MAKWGSCDFRDLKNFRDRLESLTGGGEADAFCRSCATELAQRLLRKVTKRTPAGSYEVIQYVKKDGSTLTYNEGRNGGNLRRSWKIGIVEKQGNQYVIEVYNPVEYASYVEYGHRQEPGRFVPHIGKRLKSSWVPGQFFLTISEKEIQKAAPAILEKKLYDFLKGVVR